MQETFVFDSDQFWTASSKLIGTTDSGNWNFEKHNLILINNRDTMIFEIKKFTKSELIWMTNFGESDLRFELEKEKSQQSTSPRR